MATCSHHHTQKHLCHIETVAKQTFPNLSAVCARCLVIVMEIATAIEQGLHWHRAQKEATSQHRQGRGERVSYRCEGQREMSSRLKKRDQKGVPWRKKPVWKVKQRLRTNEINLGDWSILWVEKAMRAKFRKVSRGHIAQVWMDLGLCPNNWKFMSLEKGRHGKVVALTQVCKTWQTQR